MNQPERKPMELLLTHSSPTLLGLGTAVGYTWWYGYHVPSVRHRDNFYTKLEDERAKALGQ